MKKPSRDLPPEHSPSFSAVGLFTQPGTLIEVRAPDPDNPKGEWQRLYLKPSGARSLLDWLPNAIEMSERHDV